MRIPRKKKKEYKKLWVKRDGVRRYIVKKTIGRDKWPDIDSYKGVWGCMTRLKHDKL